MSGFASNYRIEANNLAVANGDIGLRRIRLLSLQRVPDQEPVQLWLPAGKSFDNVGALQFLDAEQIRHRSTFRIEHGGLTEEPLEARTTVWRRVERSDERLPVLAIEQKDAPIGEPFLGLVESRIENEFADGFAGGGRRRLRASLLRPGSSRRSSFAVRLLRWVILRRPAMLPPLWKAVAHMPDNVMTDRASWLAPIYQVLRNLTDLRAPSLRGAGSVWSVTPPRYC